VIGNGPPTRESAAHLLDSPVVRTLLAPTQPFVRAFAADNFAGLLAWGAAALLINAALLALVMRLDANYLEAAAAAGERVYEQAQRIRRGDWFPVLKPAGTARRVPPLPWLGGAGPTVWRQLTTLLRRWPRILFMAAVCAVTFVAILYLGRRLPKVQGVVIPALIYLTILLVAALRFDFRGDLDHIPWLKSMPLRPLPLAAGQLAVPTAVLALFHLLAIAAVAAAIAPWRRGALVALALVVPLDLLLMAIENLVFLLFPHRQGPPTELAVLGRHMLMFFLKFLAIGVACALALGCALIAYAATRSLPIATVVGFLALTAQSLALIPAVARAYTRFDPAADTPP
jgi:hypothetical protein